MLDVTSRQIVASRVIDDRLAEARRAHLLREIHDETPAFSTGGKVAAGPSLIERLAEAIHRGTTPAHGRPAFR